MDQGRGFASAAAGGEDAGGRGERGQGAGREGEGVLRRVSEDVREEYEG